MNVALLPLTPIFMTFSPTDSKLGQKLGDGKFGSTPDWSAGFNGPALIPSAVLCRRIAFARIDV